MTRTFALTRRQRERADALVDSALAFLEAQDYPLGVTIVRYLWRSGPANDIVAALSAFQNTDGGFGKGLEVDIKAPVSNAFAARLAMQVMRLVDLDLSAPMRARLATWLADTQHEDGDWHFPKEVYDAPLAPWFAGWEFPSLNPACCVVGNAIPMQIATDTMRERVARLFAEKASHDDARSGDFYRMLPYIEYVGIEDVPDRDAWLASLAEGIVTGVETGTYADAQHVFDHALAAGPGLVSRLPEGLLPSQVERLLAEPQDDGGWPTPYDPAWRLWFTTTGMMTLARLRDGVCLWPLTHRHQGLRVGHRRRSRRYYATPTGRMDATASPSASRSAARTGSPAARPPTAALPGCCSRPAASPTTPRAGSDRTRTRR